MSTSKKIPPPSTKVLLNAFVLSVKLAKRIDNDFYRDSFNGLIKEIVSALIISISPSISFPS